MHTQKHPRTQMDSKQWFMRWIVIIYSALFPHLRLGPTTKWSLNSGFSIQKTTKFREPLTMEQVPSSDPYYYSTTPTLKMQRASQKKGQKDCKSQSTRTSVAGFYCFCSSGRLHLGTQHNTAAWPRPEECQYQLKGQRGWVNSYKVPFLYEDHRQSIMTAVRRRLSLPQGWTLSNWLFSAN